MNGSEPLAGVGVAAGVGDYSTRDTVCEKVRERWTDRLGFDQKGVVAVVGVDKVMCDARVDRPHRLGELFGLTDGELPVGGKRHDQRLAVEGRERVGVTVEPRRQVVVVHRPAQVEIRVRVEPVDKRLGLVVEIRLHVPVRKEPACPAGRKRAGGVTTRPAAAELALHRLLREIHHVAQLSRDGEAVVGVGVAVVVTAPPVRVCRDGTAGDRVERETLRVDSGGGRNRRDTVDVVGVTLCPLQDVHPTDAPADGRVEMWDTQFVEQESL